MDGVDSRQADEARLIAAYRSALYRIDDPRGEITLQVGRHSTELETLLRESGAQCAALLTAFNPGSALLSDLCNQEAQRSLLGELNAAGYRCLSGRNEDPAGRWPVEPSLLALGITLTAAHAVAARFAQAAFLWSDASGTPQLMKTAAETG